MAFMSPYPLQITENPLPSQGGRNPAGDWSTWMGTPTVPPPPVPQGRDAQQQLRDQLWQRITELGTQISRGRTTDGDPFDTDEFTTLVAAYRGLITSYENVNKALGADQKEGTNWAPAYGRREDGTVTFLGWTDPISGALTRPSSGSGSLQAPADYRAQEVGGELWLISNTDPNEPPHRAGLSADQASTAATAAANRATQLEIAQGNQAVQAEQNDITRMGQQLQRELYEYRVKNDEREHEIAGQRLSAQDADRQQRADEARLVDTRTRLVEGIKFLSETQRAQWSAQLNQEDWDKDVWQTMQRAIDSANNRASAEEIAGYQGAVSQRNSNLGVARDLALAYKEMYLDSLRNTVNVPTGWAEAFQKGLKALAAGQAAPRDWMAGIPALTHPEPDWQFFNKRLAEVLGTDPNNPLPPSIQFQRGPRQELRPEPTRKDLMPAYVTPQQVMGTLGFGDLYTSPPPANGEGATPTVEDVLQDYENQPFPGISTGLDYLPDASSEVDFLPDTPFPGMEQAPDEAQFAEPNFIAPPTSLDLDAEEATQTMFPALQYAPPEYVPNLSAAMIGTLLGDEPEYAYAQSIQGTDLPDWMLGTDYDDEAQRRAEAMSQSYGDYDYGGYDYGDLDYGLGDFYG